METARLKKFAQKARRELIEQVSARLAQVLAEASLARREQPGAVKKLQSEIQAHGEQEVIERAAYTWFNRFCALRFMDANHYNRVGVVSPAAGETQPEILAEAKSGHVDETMVPEAVRKRVLALLSGQEQSRNPQGQAYQLLLVAVCNYWHEAMPFMFERIADYTELLMPEDLLSENSVLGPMRVVMTVEACQDVEIIGWLYQFYISEKKDQVFAGLKKNQKITAENIPAATQLFTPHWIVRYLVENSLGRLWMLNRPGSRLAERMDYYIEPDEPEADFLKLGSPEEIRICDPACGSGHMLTYAFDLLYAIYEEEGYDATEIPALILTHNLTGVEIDDRAGALAAFALMMKAAARLGRRRFLRMEAKPDICVLENVAFTAEDFRDAATVVGKDLFTEELRETLGQFAEAKNFGSLIVPKLRDPTETLRVVEARVADADLVLKPVMERLANVLRMAEALSPKYHVVVANPPYMSGKGMNGKLQDFLNDNFGDVKSDLFSAFMVRNTNLAISRGQLGFMTPFVWMFISSYEKLRLFLLENKTITSLIQLEYSGFDGATVPICTFTLENSRRLNFNGAYVRLSDFRGATNQAPRALEAIRNKGCSWFHRAKAEDFKRISGAPIAYWLSHAAINAYAVGRSIGEEFHIGVGLQTGDNAKFIRNWFEVSRRKTSQLNDHSNAAQVRWFPCIKGGDYRKWFGHQTDLIDWEGSGRRIKANVPSAVVRNESLYFKPCAAWSKITSGKLSLRFHGEGFVINDASCIITSDEIDKLLYSMGAINSFVFDQIFGSLSPTLNFPPGQMQEFPLVPHLEQKASVATIVRTLIEETRSDWDAYETSWDFTRPPFLAPDHRGETLEATYATLRAHWQGMIDEMQRLEEENNRVFIDAYGLQNELTPEVPTEEITLTCNPAYRYGVKGTEEDREKRLLADTMAEFLSYAVGCMFGRYSLDKPGLILANQGETLADYLAQVPEPSFEPDDDNVIPILDAAWFTDGIVERFREFLKVTFGTEHYEENLEFIESALGKDIRKYFLNDFYKDHWRRYKKRPIYWLFSSPKGSFNALIYMHRYRSDTVSVILNDYLREFRTKLEVRLANLEEVEASTDASKRDKTAAVKEINQIRSTLDELDDWERKVMLPLAEQKIEINLDDGVKANYPKFGDALKKIPGLSA